ncbi:MAG TPA: radical SAM family heme chaperone HemW [Candidatus Omnitrophota bacterium]|nr:radical SAM family heme chaperone HemW [Candidatus Omnitrophota bacterium]HPS36310.1 radical SAM family heme chaperone HemW [Candidatus Omnitrophota bacterium]
MEKGLYVHIPFCRGRCHYCNFVSEGEPSPEFRKRFLDALVLEAEATFRRFGKLSFATFYLGGGTPSILTGEEITFLMKTVRDRFRFAADAEITAEWNPGDGDEERLRIFRDLGVNRISLGAQSFRDVLLNRLGRRHSVRDILETLRKIRATGISNISLDLMLRIPGQTPDDFRHSLDQCVALEASQVSLYDLEVHEGTVLGDLKRDGSLDLPGEEDHARMYEAAIRTLTQAGYEHYEISNFAMPGAASRHNLLYWHNREYLGLGPGAFSYLGGIRYQFATDTGHYLAKCEARDWTRDQEDALSEEDKEVETFVTGLRLRKGVRPGDFKKIYPKVAERVATLCGEGLMEFVGEDLRLTRRGKFLSEDVFGFLLKKDISSEDSFL